MAGTRYCEHHGEYPATSDDGSRSILHCPRCKAEEEAERERELAERRKEYRREQTARRLAYSGLRPRHRLCLFDNYRAETAGQQVALGTVRGYAKTFAERRAEGRNLILCGGLGTGKTHLAAALVRHVIEADEVPVTYALAQVISLRVRETYDKGAAEGYREAISAYVKPDLLVVDEVGVQSSTDHEKRIFYDLLNARYEQIKPTVLISNYEPQAFERWLGDRVMDRLQEGGCDVVRFDWESYRRRVAQDTGRPSAAEIAEVVEQDEAIRNRRMAVV